MKINKFQLFEGPFWRCQNIVCFFYFKIFQQLIIKITLILLFSFLSSFILFSTKEVFLENCFITRSFFRSYCLLKKYNDDADRFSYDSDSANIKFQPQKRLWNIRSINFYLLLKWEEQLQKEKASNALQLTCDKDAWDFHRCKRSHAYEVHQSAWILRRNIRL